MVTTPTIPTPSDYQAAIDEFCSDNADLDVYLAGEISHPGISDLDFIVLDEEPIVSPRVEPFLQGGNVLVIPSEIFPMVDWVEQFDLKLVQGDPRERIPRPIEFEEMFLALDIIEWLPERILKFARGKPKTWSSRELQLYAKSLDRSISNVERYVDTKFERSVTVEDLRSQETITSDDVLPYMTDAVFAWTWFVHKFGHITGNAQGVFRLSSYYAGKNEFELLMMYFCVLATIPCDLTTRLKERISIIPQNFWVRETFEQLIVTRWQVIDMMHRGLRRNGVKKGAMKYGWLYTPDE